MSIGGFGIAGSETMMGAANPSLLFVQGTEQRKIQVQKIPFSIGRKTEKDLVVADPRVSRDHALIVRENDGFYLVDQGRRHGTFGNGERVERRRLKKNDKLEFGVRGEAYTIFDPDRPVTSPSQGLHSQLSVWKPASATSDLET